MSAQMAAEKTRLEEKWAELERLHEEALALLEGLDRLGLYQASAYVSMAIDVMRRRHPNLGSSE